MSAVSRTPPKARIPVSSARMEELDKAIREKTKQNTDQFNMARENFQDDVVKSNLQTTQLILEEKNMSKQYNNFMHKFLMYMGLVMLYLTVVYIVPIELNSPFDTSKIIGISIVYIPWACWYFNNTFNNNSKTDQLRR